MTREEFKTLLEKTGISVFWHHASTAEPLPVIAYFSDQTMNIGADGGVYMKVPVYSVAIYASESESENKSELLESLFDEANIFYNKVMQYDEVDRVWVTLYENILL